MTTKQEGSFPLACVGPSVKGNEGGVDSLMEKKKDNIGQRHSSLYLPNENTNSGDYGSYR